MGFETKRIIEYWPIIILPIRMGFEITSTARIIDATSTNE